jgi:hypothetical protein
LEDPHRLFEEPHWPFFIASRPAYFSKALYSFRLGNGYTSSASSGYCALSFPMAFFRGNTNAPVERTMRHRAKLKPAVFVVLSLLPFLTSSGSSQNQTGNPAATGTQGQTQMNGNVVYVCACLKTKSCSCMTEAKTGGPCACGTEGGPPLKAVPKDSDWAKENRKALAK